MKRQTAAAACLVFFALAFLLSGCAASSQGQAVVPDDAPEIYLDALGAILPGTRVVRSSGTAFDALRAGAAVWTSDGVAVPAMEAGAAEHWYPLVASTVVIALDRGAPDAEKIGGWRDLESTELTVGMPQEPESRLIAAAMSYGLEGGDYTLGSTGRLLSSLARRGLLRLGSSDAQVLLCTDDYAAALCAAGRDLEIIVPREGTFTYSLGLMCRGPLSLPANASEILLSRGFRLTDGRCGSGAYPSAAEYAPASAPGDYGRLASVGMGVTVMLRRDVSHSRIFSSADQAEHVLSATIFCMVAVVWASMTMRRAMQESVRRGALHTALLLIGWTLVRLLKYQLTHSPVLTSYLWYSYYFFMLSLPLVLLRIALELETGGRHGFSEWFSAAAVVNAALFVLTFTNNIHHLVFRFDFSDPNWSGSYSYTAAYYVIYAVIAAEIAAAVVILLAKSRRSPRRAAPAMPLLVFALFTAYSVGYFLRVPAAVNSDFTVVSGLFTVLFFEAAIHAGLVPVNSMYAFFFRSSTLNLQIIDSAGEPVLSAGPPPDAELIARLAAGQSPVPGGGDVMLYADPITGGMAVWQEDMSALNALEAQLRETQRRLRETNAILAREEAAGARLMTAEEHEEMFARLEQETRELTAKLSGMIRELPETEDHRLQAARINLLLCCIKRRCNLYFIGRGSDRMPAVDLMVYIDELADFARYTGVQAVTASDISSFVPLRQAALIYGVFYEILSWASLSGAASLVERLYEDGASYCLGVFPSRLAADFAPGEASAALIAALGADYRVIELDGSDAIRLTVPKGGDADD